MHGRNGAVEFGDWRDTGMRICRKNRLTIALVALLQCQGYGDSPQGPTPALAQGLFDVDPENARPRRPQNLPRARSPRPPPPDDTEARRSQAPAASEVNRSILALYDGAEESEASETRIHKQLELPLNHLGYRVTYWDLRSGLPPLAEARRHKAIATWFGERIPNPRAYLDWAIR